MRPSAVYQSGTRWGRPRGPVVATLTIFCSATKARSSSSLMVIWSLRDGIRRETYSGSPQVALAPVAGDVAGEVELGTHRQHEDGVAVGRLDTVRGERRRRSAPLLPAARRVEALGLVRGCERTELVGATDHALQRFHHRCSIA